MELGYGGASTAEIARRARVSKRDLYARFSSKQGIIAALVSARVALMQAPLQQADCTTRERLATTLRRFGATVLHEASRPGVLALYRLAISEAQSDTAIGEVLDSAGRGINGTSLAKLLADAQRRRLLDRGDPDAMAASFLALLWGDLFTRLLLGTARPPSPVEAERRAQHATAILLRLHPAA
jgi:AcrR family transcriptional regulator